VPCTTCKWPPYQLAPQLDLWADTRDFEASLTRARQASGDAAVRALEHAVELYRAPLLADVSWRWAAGPRMAYQSRFIRAALVLAEALASAGQNALADALAERVLEIEPTNEEAYERLLQSAQARGDRAAVRQLAGTYGQALARAGLAPAGATLVEASR
jgi:DNA-binding SARP family transcriptional activator